ncbi:MAG: hypothetical protein AAFO29_09165, partial [Actinomycetota bacterium]
PNPITPNPNTEPTLEGTMATAAEINAAVQTDVIDGLGSMLPAVHDHDGFDIVGPFAGTGPLVDGDYAVVQWRYRGGDTSPRSFNGLWPTGECIEVRGLTVVDMSGDDWLFHRHVDWNAVNSQLGGSRGRTSINWAPGTGSGDRRMAKTVYAGSDGSGPGVTN